MPPIERGTKWHCIPEENEIRLVLQVVRWFDTMEDLRETLSVRWRIHFQICQIWRIAEGRGGGRERDHY